MKECSRSQKNKRNNICKTSAIHLLHNDIIQKWIIELLIGWCKTPTTHPERIHMDRVIYRDIKQILYDWCNAVNQKNILQRPCIKMPAAPPTPYRIHIIKSL